MDFLETKTKNQVDSGGSPELIWYLSVVVMLLLISTGAVGVLSSCGNTEKIVDTALAVVNLSPGDPSVDPIVLHVGDGWRHDSVDVTIVVESLDAKTNEMGGGISINGSQKLYVQMELDHFVEVIANNVDYIRVLSVKR